MHMCRGNNEAVLSKQYKHYQQSALRAASPCPPPPPPVVYPLSCPVPAKPVDGRMSPRCLNSDCKSWGAAKAYDGKTSGTSSVAAVDWADHPYMQFDLGASPPNVSAVRITTRSDCCLEQAHGLYVYLSSDPTNFRTGNTLCAGNLSFTTLGTTQTLLCQAAVFGKRYLTVQMNTSENTATKYLSLQEVTPVYDGKPH